MSDASGLPIGIKVPKGATLDRIDHQYGPLPDKVPCGLPGCGTPHLHGYVVDFTDPTTEHSGQAIIGHVCGKKHFGKDWVAAQRQFRAEQSAARVREMADNFLRIADEVAPRLRVLVPGLNARRAIRAALDTADMDLMRQCITAWRERNGRMLFSRGYDKPPLPFQLEGKLFFLQNMALKKATRTLRVIDEVRDFLKTSPQPPNFIKEVGDRIARLGDLRKIADEVEAEARDGIAALRPDRMRKLISLIDTDRVLMRNTVLYVYLNNVFHRGLGSSVEVYLNSSIQTEQATIGTVAGQDEIGTLIRVADLSTVLDE